MHFMIGVIVFAFMCWAVVRFFPAIVLVVVVCAIGIAILFAVLAGRSNKPNDQNAVAANSVAETPMPDLSPPAPPPEVSVEASPKKVEYELDPQRNTVVSIYNLDSKDEADLSCTKITNKTVTIIDRVLENKGNAVSYIIFEENDGTQSSIIIPPIPISEGSTAEFDWIKSGILKLTETGRAATVNFYYCGSRQMNLLDAIK